jgi:hypothetical protein
MTTMSDRRRATGGERSSSSGGRRPEVASWRLLCVPLLGLLALVAIVVLSGG